MKCSKCGDIHAVRWLDDGDTLTTYNAKHEIVREAKCYGPTWLCGNCGYIVDLYSVSD